MSHYSKDSKMKQDTKKRPPLFHEIGASHREVLADVFVGQNIRITASTTTARSVTLTSTGAKNLQRTVEGVLLDDSISGNVALTKELPLSTFAEADFAFPDYKRSKFSLWFLSRYATLSMAASHHPLPGIKCSATTGTPSITLGFEMDARYFFRTMWHWTAAIQVKRPTWDAHMLLHNYRFLASYVRYLDKAKKISVGAKIDRSFVTHESNFTAGGSWDIGHLIAVKARIDRRGRLGTLLHLKIKEKACLRISGEFDIKDFNKKPGMGLAVALDL